MRENTEGFYADHRHNFVGSGEFMPTPDVALAVVFTRSACERIAREAFSLADRRRRKVTIVHKTNVLSMTAGLFAMPAGPSARGFAGRRHRRARGRPRGVSGSTR